MYFQGSYVPFLSVVALVLEAKMLTSTFTVLLTKLIKAKYESNNPNECVRN